MLDNVILVGMPGAGKSTVGVLLAKALRFGFVDTDLLIQAAEGRGLQELIDTRGMDAFLDLEARWVARLDCHRCVIATGGSVVYRENAMRHLAELGQIIFLDVPLAEIKGRLSNLASRGVVLAPGQDLDALYAERLPLYRATRDIHLDCAGLDHESVVAQIIAAIDNQAKERD